MGKARTKYSSRGEYLRNYWLQTPSWKKVEKLVVIRLREKGVRCRYVGRNHVPFDALTRSGLRLEIKSGEYSVKHKSWTLTIARGAAGRKRLTEHLVDFYIFVLKGHPSMGLNRKPIYLIVPSPLGKHTVHLTLRQLFGKWHSAIGNWPLITDAEQRRLRDAAKAAATAAKTGEAKPQAEQLLEAV